MEMYERARIQSWENIRKEQVTVIACFNYMTGINKEDVACFECVE